MIPGSKATQRVGRNKDMVVLCVRIYESQSQELSRISESIKRPVADLVREALTMYAGAMRKDGV